MPRHPPAPTPCAACGDERRDRRLNPSIGVGFLLLGTLVLVDGVGGAWSRGLDSIHAVVGLTLLGAAIWGLLADLLTLRAEKRAWPSLWIEARAVCRGCGLRAASAPDLRAIRVALVIALLAFGAVVVGRVVA